jgi:hypothetical protein
MPSTSTIGNRTKYPGSVKVKLTPYRSRQLSSQHSFHRLRADRIQLRVAQLAAADLHESNNTSSRGKTNK